MQKIILSILLSLFITIVNANKEVENANQLDIQERVIENGLRVIVVNMKTNGSVMFGVGYFVGAADDPRNVVGISHFLEHMMFTGTKNIGETKLKEIIEQYNKESNAFTGNDITFYYHKCNKFFLDIDMRVEADRMQNLALNEERIEKEKKVIIEERKMQWESSPLTKFVDEAALKTIFLYSNYAYPVIGYLDQIKNCDKRALRKHYEKFYSPGNAFILFTGDITIDEATQKVRKYFGSVKSRPAVKRDRVIDPQETGIRHTIDHFSDQISIRNLRMIFKINRDLINSLKDESILEIIIGILGMDKGSILYKTLVDKKELCYSLNTSLEIQAFDKGIIEISAEIRDGISEKLIEQEIEEIAYNFVDKYLTKELFETEKQKALAKIELYQDSPNSMQMLVLTNVCNGRSVKELKDLKNIIERITFEEVKKISKLLLKKENKILQIYTHPKSK